ncbi:hypothetical protein LCGC14_1149000, partial [marine sediment metagenome]
MTEKKGNLMLKWINDNSQFRPTESDSDMVEGIFVELNEEDAKWKYFYIKGASLI